MPAAAALLITPDDLAELRRRARSAQLPAVLAQRAYILLLAADGVANTQIAQRVGVSRPTVMACRRRYDHGGLNGLPAPTWQAADGPSSPCAWPVPSLLSYPVQPRPVYKPDCVLAFQP